MLERARQVTAAERLDNIRYELGDAQVHRFDPAGFDVAISRFGTMFFSDPAAAFANIAAALRPEARLVLLVWQRRERQRMGAGDRRRAGRRGAATAAGARTRSRSAMPKPPRACSRAPASPTCASRTYASRSSTATTSMPRSRVVQGFQDTGAALASLSDDEAARTVERLRETLAAHFSDERGVALDSRSWLITARRRR